MWQRLFFVPAHDRCLSLMGDGICAVNRGFHMHEQMRLRLFYSGFSGARIDHQRQRFAQK
jgi:hypothetical protein